MIYRIFAALLVVLSLSLAVPAQSWAFDPFGAICQAGGGESALCQEKSKNTTDPLTGTNGLFRGISNIIALIAGIAAVIVLITAGIRYATSGGDPQKAKAAKDVIVYTLIGLVVIVLADSLIVFVITRI